MADDEDDNGGPEPRDRKPVPANLLSPSCVHYLVHGGLFVCDDYIVPSLPNQPTPNKAAHSIAFPGVHELGHRTRRANADAKTTTSTEFLPSFNNPTTILENVPSRLKVVLVKDAGGIVDMNTKSY
ncbi:hypothetical protein Cni_G29524 [Canna indica]|uniref:Uncharacterized protein n=1 Tax=Canna indica TaxID=4628 RepID=A0AAQ3L500_9LILI|nr:hypothetical protein Cni_G29524 [Canna indica]